MLPSGLALTADYPERLKNGQIRPSGCSGSNGGPDCPACRSSRNSDSLHEAESKRCGFDYNRLKDSDSFRKRLTLNSDGSRNIEVLLNCHARERIRLGPNHLHRNDSAEQRLAAIRVNGVQVFRFAGQLAGDPS